MVMRWMDPQSSSVPALALSDPYAEWAVETHWLGFASALGRKCIEKQDEVLVIGEHLDKVDKGLVPNLQIASLYGQDLPGTGYRPPFSTARLTRAELEQGLMRQNPNRLRWRLAVPLWDAERQSRLSSKGWFGEERDDQVGWPPRLDEACVKAAESTSARRLNVPPGALAIIDYGCPFAHDKLVERCGPGGAQRKGTRVKALWDQGQSPEAQEIWPLHLPQGLPRGREMREDVLQSLCNWARQGGVEETELYRRLRYLVDVDDERRRVWFATHGGHLLDVMAGWPDPVTGTGSDFAGRADLLFVQLPAPTAMDSSGGSLGAHLLDGVRYAMNQVKPGEPLVINISFGGQAGPHDGSSLIEQALDDLLKNGPGNVAVVLAAGNARLAEAHVRREVAKDRSAVMRLLLPSGDSTDSFVECWYTAPTKGKLQCRVRLPDGRWSGWLGPDQSAVLKGDSRKTVAMVQHRASVPNGSRAMVLLALGPTRLPRDAARALAEPGEWQIEWRWKRAPKEGSCAVDAWIEREEPGRFVAADRPRFLDQSDRDDLATLCSIATGTRTFVVGGFNGQTREPAPYSSFGRDPAGRPLPDVFALCEQDLLQPNIRAAATRSGESARLNGTSVAAPVLARRLYNHLVAHHRVHPNQPLRTQAEWQHALREVVSAHPGELMLPG